MPRRRVPLGFGTLQPVDCGLRVVRVRAAVPFAPEKVIIASPYLILQGAQLLGDGEPYELKHRNLPAGGHLDVLGEPREAQEFEFHLSTRHVATVGLLGTVEVPEIPEEPIEEVECDVIVCEAYELVGQGEEPSQ